jgi:hypothetical protein
MKRGPRWYFIAAALALVAVSLITALALAGSAGKPPAVRYVAADEDFQKQVLDRLDKLADRLERLEARVGEYEKGRQSGVGESERTELGDVRESLEALQEDLKDRSGRPGDLEDTYRLLLKEPSSSELGDVMKDMDVDVRVIGEDGAGTLDSEQLGELRDVLKGLAKEHGRVEYKLEDSEWSIKMDGTVPDDVHEHLDKICQELTGKDKSVNVECTIDKDGTCMLSITKGGEGVPEMRVKVLRDNDKAKDLFLQAMPKPMPEKLKAELKKLNEEHRAKVKKLLKEYGYDEKDFPLLGLGLGLGDTFDAIRPYTFQLKEGTSVPRALELYKKALDNDGAVLKLRTYDEDWLKQLQEQLEKLQDMIQKQLDRQESGGEGET